MLSCLLTLAGCSHYQSHGYVTAANRCSLSALGAGWFPLRSPISVDLFSSQRPNPVATISELKKFSKAQKELMAMIRASKLDLQALSERLYGTTILEFPPR